MEPLKDYKEINRQSWNNRVQPHWDSEFYNVQGFVAGDNPLSDIELALLTDIKGKSVLHLQCHFGQDTLAIVRLGATVTGVDISDKAIEKARELSTIAGIPATFVCCDIYDLPQHLDAQFDIVFTSYGTIGWLPDLDKWASVISKMLKPGGTFIFVEFHPVIWMFDDDFKDFKYNYFNDGPIVETESGTYAQRDAPITQQYVMWNHGLGEVLNSLIKNGLQIGSIGEFDYSPKNCFRGAEEFAPGTYRIKRFGNNIPIVYALTASKKL